MQTLIYKIFTRKFSLSLQADALLYLSDVIAQKGMDHASAQAWLELLADTWTKREEGKPLVELGPLKALVSAITSADTTTTTTTTQADGPWAPDLFSVINAFDVPSWWFDPGQKKFTKPFDSSEMLAPAEAKAALFRQRYDLLKQRVLRNENFMPVSFSNSEKDRLYQLSTVDSLQGREGEHFLLLGMLAQMEEGRVFLEDKDGSIELDLARLPSQSPSGLYTEGCFVLADGYVKDNVFVVEQLGFPPPEPRTTTLQAFPNTNLFGAEPSVRTPAQLKAIEAEHDSGIVILSDVWLDHAPTMEALHALFEGFSQDVPPIAFILTGDFCSKPFVPGSGETAQYRDNLSALGQLIAGFPNIARQSHFVFVPGANDPWGQGALPKPPIPEFFTKRLASKLAKVTFATNPCRIRFCTQEIIVFREDLLKRIRRNSILPPAEDAEIVKHLVRTVVDQGHLCPLPQRIRPVYWAYDHAMRVYPIPDVLVLAD
ncbi:DNA-directed DNA polymerase epsilon, subunit B, partial [Linderina pennispora]